MKRKKIHKIYKNARIELHTCTYKKEIYMYAGRRYKAEKARHLQERRRKTRDSLTISYPGLTPEASVNTRFESLESVAIATASSINERPAGLILLVEVESFSGTGRTGSAVNWLFADRCIITTKTVTRSIRRRRCRTINIG